jgi:hypothetical protein
MQERPRRTALVKGTLVFTAAIALALAMPAGTASAGFFDMLFGGGRHSAQPPVPAPLAPLVRAFADPSGGGVIEGDRRESGPSVAYCVRLCDGHPFPVQTTSSSPAQACASFCPAAQTKVFSGSSIDSAVATDGKRYSSLPTAFTYRKQLVADCTCNGKSAGGLVRIDAKADPTLRPGDIVATNDGLMSFRGSTGKNAEFSPIQDRKLANVQIRPSSSPNAAALAARAEVPPPRSVDEPASKESRRRVQR